MTAPPRPALLADLFNDIVAWLNRRYRARITELEAAIVAEWALTQHLEDAS